MSDTTEQIEYTHICFSMIFQGLSGMKYSALSSVPVTCVRRQKVAVDASMNLIKFKLT